MTGFVDLFRPFELRGADTVDVVEAGYECIERVLLLLEVGQVVLVEFLFLVSHLAVVLPLQLLGVLLVRECLRVHLLSLFVLLPLQLVVLLYLLHLLLCALFLLRFLVLLLLLVQLFPLQLQCEPVLTLSFQIIILVRNRLRLLLC